MTHKGHARIQKVLSEGVQLWKGFFLFSWWGEVRFKNHHLAFRLRADDGQTLNAALVALWFFGGSGPVLLSNPIVLWFSGGGGVWTSSRPSGSAHKGRCVVKHQTNKQRKVSGETGPSLLAYCDNTLSKISNWSPYIFCVSFKNKIRLYKIHASINQPRPFRNSACHFI